MIKECRYKGEDNKHYRILKKEKEGDDRLVELMKQGGTEFDFEQVLAAKDQSVHDYYIMQQRRLFFFWKTLCVFNPNKTEPFEYAFFSEALIGLQDVIRRRQR